MYRLYTCILKRTNEKKLNQKMNKTRKGSLSRFKENILQLFSIPKLNVTQNRQNMRFIKKNGHLEKSTCQQNGFKCIFIRYFINLYQLSTNGSGNGTIKHELIHRNAFPIFYFYMIIFHKCS